MPGVCSECQGRHRVKRGASWVRCPKCSPLNTRALAGIPRAPDPGPDAYPQYPRGDPRRTFGF